MTQSARPTRKPRPPTPPATLLKCPTGIGGLDQITFGGLPAGRTTLVCGSSGTGKTLMCMEFLVKGAAEYGEPGLFMAFEESAAELAQNVASLGFDLSTLIADRKLLIDHVQLDGDAITETGDYNLDGLFIRLGHAIEAIGAKRVVLDAIENLFSSLPNAGILRRELRRLFNWLKSRGVTALITGERGEGAVTRHGLEEYVSDCVLLVDVRVVDQIATRRLRIVKYRGSAHGADEYPFLLDDKGFTVVPITAIGLKYGVATECISTGIPKLDAMFDGKGYYRGGTLLVSGAPGTGKSSVAAHFADAACRRGERCLYVGFEESTDQLMRNMRSIGIELQAWVDQGLLHFEATRPSSCGLETHLAMTQRVTDEFQPQVVVFDPISSLASAGTHVEIKNMLMRMLDFFKSRQITTLFTTLTPDSSPTEQTEVGISSLIDAWVQLRNLERGGERTRLLYILKARGMGHSNRVREFLLTEQGVDLVEVYFGPTGIITGSERELQELQYRSAYLAQEQEALRRKALIDHKRRVLEARILELQAEFEAEELAAQRLDESLASQWKFLDTQRSELAVDGARPVAPAAIAVALRHPDLR